MPLAKLCFNDVLAYILRCGSVRMAAVTVVYRSPLSLIFLLSVWGVPFSPTRATSFQGVEGGLRWLFYRYETGARRRSSRLKRGKGNCSSSRPRSDVTRNERPYTCTIACAWLNIACFCIDLTCDRYNFTIVKHDTRIYDVSSHSRRSTT